MKRFERIVVLDVGGTWQRCGLYDPGRDLVERVVRRKTRSKWSGMLPDKPSETGLDVLLDDLRNLILDVGGRDVDALSLAIAGPVSSEGKVLALPTILGDEAVSSMDLDFLSSSLGFPHAAILNDMTAAALGVATPDCEDFALVTVSSGIGMRLHMNGKVVLGSKGWAGEIGHYKVDNSAAAMECYCGGRGHLGGIASGRGVLATAQRLASQGDPGFRPSLASQTEPADFDTYLLARLFAARDPWVCGIVERSCEALGKVLGVVQSAVGIQRFIVVGGFARALGPRYVASLAASVAACCWDLGQDWSKMFALGDPLDEVALLGAGRYFVHRLEGADFHEGDC